MLKFIRNCRIFVLYDMLKKWAMVQSHAENYFPITRVPVKENILFEFMIFKNRLEDEYMTY